MTLEPRDGGEGHRRDIDGLRAIAVIPVLLFHARVPGWSGGFVGVDIFFVISGYLITTLLKNDIEANRFSLARFYERRIRRILPALFAVLVASSIAAYALYLPTDLREYAKSLMATLFFSSNMLFWRQTGYFDAPAESQAFLHTWSLSVEEQFYILYPLFLFLIARYFRQRFALGIAVMFFLSLALSIWATRVYPGAAFYLAPVRAWELLLGAMLATRVLPETRNRSLANLLGLIGLVCIGYSVMAFSTATSFPGVHALIPTIGAALVIYSALAATPWVSKALGFGPLVFVGLISYSLYLWHWVLLVFAKYYLVRPITHREVAVVLTASFLLAVMSWRFVESPFRGRRGIGSRAQIFSSAVVSTLALASFGAIAWTTAGLPNRFDEPTRRLLAGSDTWARHGECDSRICRTGATDAAESFVLWGDSHAGSIAPAAESAAAAKHVAGLIAYMPACPPLLGLARYKLGQPQTCALHNDSVLAAIEAAHIKTLILHAEWAYYVEGRHYRRNAAVSPEIIATPNKPVEDTYAKFDELLRTTVAELQRRQMNVTIVASVPEIGVHVPAVALRKAMSGSYTSVTLPFAEFARHQTRAFESIRRTAREFGVSVVYPHELLCDATGCAMLQNGGALYADDNHLSTLGAMLFQPMFVRLLTESPKPRR